MVYLLGRSDFELGRDFCAAQALTLWRLEVQIPVIKGGKGESFLLPARHTGLTLES